MAIVEDQLHAIALIMERFQAYTFLYRHDSPLQTCGTALRAQACRAQTGMGKAMDLAIRPLHT